MQVLWHLKSFATPFLSLPPPPDPPASAPEAVHSEVRLFRAFRCIFQRLSQAQATVATDAERTELPRALSPDGLRRALPSAFAEGMQDASECLHEVLTMLHRAEAGHDQDISLPRPFVVHTSAHQAAAPGGGSGSSGAGGASGGSWAARLANAPAPEPESSAPPEPLHATSHVSRIFGLTVQVESTARSAPSGRVAVDRFTRFFQHVNTEPLARAAAAKRGDGSSFDWSRAVRDSGFDEGVSVRLLSRPEVLALQVIWPAATPGAAAIKAVLAAMEDCQTMDLSRLFTGVAPNSMFRLKCAFAATVSCIAIMPAQSANIHCLLFLAVRLTACVSGVGLSTYVDGPEAHRHD